MSQGLFSGVSIGDVTVIAEDNRGHPPEYWAERATKQILGSSYQHLGPRGEEQAKAFREKVKATIYQSILGALKSDRQTLAGVIRKDYSPVVADQILNYRLDR